MATSMTLPVAADGVLIVGTGGEARTQAVWADGRATDAVQQRDGADLRRLTGVAVSVAGIGLDGASVTTTTALDEVSAGMVYRAEGSVEVTMRAVGRPGFGDRGPRGELVTSVYVERLVPAGSVMDLVKAPGGSGRRAAAEAS